MLKNSSIYKKFITFIINRIVKSQIINLGINFSEIQKSQSIIYVIPYYSKINLLILRKTCIQNNLPDPLIPINIKEKTLPRYIFLFKEEKTNLFHKNLVKNLQKYLDLQNKNNNLYIFLISVMLDRAPIKKNTINNNKLLNFYRIIKNIFRLIILGRNSFIYFSKLIPLRNIIKKNKNKNIKIKLIRLANIYFIRQKLNAIGPIKISRYKLFKKFLKNKNTIKIIKNNSKIKKISYKQSEKKAKNIIKEIASNYSYILIFLTDLIMKYVWSKIYTGIDVKGIEKLNETIQQGNKIIYLPCHRSHMDYLLLSYVIYHQGLVPPHILAGANLNFWPIGNIFRRLGAFFIKRTFQRNKLYFTIFKEYLKFLLQHGYSLEYFIEGGRSRTGKLLHPKTGTLSVTIQNILQKNINIVLLPVYISYEHIIEETTYIKEIQGTPKKKEGLITMFRGFLKLRNLGNVYVNFGKPLNLKKYLNTIIPRWNLELIKEKNIRPTWFIPEVNNIAEKIMININKCCVINSVNLCAIALLTSDKKNITYIELVEQIDFYIKFLKNVPYSSQCILPQFMNSHDLIKDALKMNKFKIIKNKNKIDIIYVSKKNLLLMKYYRNNICHIFILLSLIINTIYRKNKISIKILLKEISLIYPMIKNDFFLRWNINDLSKIIFNILKELKHQKIILTKNEKLIYNFKKKRITILLSSIIQESLQKYAMICLILNKFPYLHNNMLEIYKKFSFLRKNKLENNLSKNDLVSLIGILKNEGSYDKNKNILDNKKIKELNDLIFFLLQDKNIISDIYLSKSFCIK